MRRLMYTILTVAFSLIGLTAFTAPAFAASPSLHVMANASKDSVCAGLDQVDSSQGCSTKGKGVQGITRAVVNILSIVVGIAAIITIIVSGLKFVTSGGDAGKVSAAKSSLIYALVGLVVAAFAQFLVHAVLARAANG